MIDPRIYQIATLSSLVALGVCCFDLDIRLPNALVIILSCLFVQYALTKALKFKQVEFKSCLISALSLCLLFRSNQLSDLLLASVLAIAGKFLIRFNGKHFFNPTNFGITAAILISQTAWISPGQWGSPALFILTICGIGTLVVTKASRLDITLGFIASYSFLLFYRAFWLNDPFTIPLHQLSNGSFLIFSFFMISDPRSTPDSRAGRLIFAALVAYSAYYIRFTYYTPNALMYALFICSFATPLLDLVIKSKKYQWLPVLNDKINSKTHLTGLQPSSI